MALIVRPNIPDPDDFYAELVALHEGRSKEESDAINARLILLLANHEPDPYMHVFLDAGNGNVLAFFELPTKPPMSADPNTPKWVQHIAFQVKDRDTLLAYKARLEANGVEVLGVTDHSLFQSIYFFDPNGHRLELACPDPNEEPMLKRLDEVKWEMLEEWSRTKRAPKHADWLHRKETRRSSS